MKKFKDSILAVSKILNEIAGFGIAIAVALVIVNIILRKVFKNPILGTYEYVGFFTSIIIGFSLPYCAILSGHIAVDLVINKLHPKMKVFIHIIITLILIFIVGLLTWKMSYYATQYMKKGEVSPTTQMPFYIFIYLIAYSFLVLLFVYIKDFILKIKEIDGVSKIAGETGSILGSTERRCS